MGSQKKKQKELTAIPPTAEAIGFLAVSIMKKLKLTLTVEHDDGSIREYTATYEGHISKQDIYNIDSEAECLRALHEEVIRQYTYGKEKKKI